MCRTKHLAFWNLIQLTFSAFSQLEILRIVRKKYIISDVFSVELQMLVILTFNMDIMTNMTPLAFPDTPAHLFLELHQ